MGDGFGLRERIANDTAKEIAWPPNPETARLGFEQRVVRDEVKRSGIESRCLICPAELTAFESGDGLGIGRQHDLLMGLQPAAQLREIDKDKPWHDAAFDQDGRAGA